MIINEKALDAFRIWGKQKFYLQSSPHCPHPDLGVFGRIPFNSLSVLLNVSQLRRNLVRHLITPFTSY